MSDDDAIFDVVMAACVRQAQHPEENGGGIIGRAAAVVKALGVDGDLPLSSIKRRPAPTPQEKAATGGASTPSLRRSLLTAAPFLIGGTPRPREERNSEHTQRSRG